MNTKLYFVCFRYLHVPDSHWLLVTTVLASSTTFLFLLLASRRSTGCVHLVNKIMLSFNPSFLLGCLACSQTLEVANDYYEMAMNVVLLLSLIVYVAWIAVRCGTVVTQPPVVMRVTELFALTGMFLALVVTSDKSVIGVFSSLAFIGLLIFSFHRKNLITIAILPLYIQLNMKTILSLHGLELMNRESLCVFTLILMAQPLLNVFVSRETALSSWEPVLGEFSSSSLSVE